MIKSVAVIGCGPSSLAAAWAAEGLGCGVEIFAPRRKSPLRGPIYLRAPIPGMTLDHPDGYIREWVEGGTILDYRRKLYGDVNITINGQVESRHAWAMHETYDKLWDVYRDRITDIRVTPGLLPGMAESFDLVVNTAPASQFCRVPTHVFTHRQVGITPECSVEGQEMNTVIMNGDPEVPWVRSSVIFGWGATEWPLAAAPPDAVIISKPLSTTCDCNPEVFRTGRFGAWKNETWVDTAYYDTRTAICEEV
jgi:hypothetical protein